MKLSAEFVDGSCILKMIPEGEWEQKLMGAVAKGGERLDALITYKTEGHFSHEKCSAVSVKLTAAEVSVACEMPASICNDPRM